MGKKKSGIDAPPFRFVRDQVGQNTSSLPDLSLSKHNSPRVTEAEEASISPPSQAEEDSPSSQVSSTTRALRWVSRLLSLVSLTSPPRPAVSPDVRRGPKQFAIAAAPPSPYYYSGPPTEFAITTSHGLKTFVHDPNRPPSSARRTASPAQADDADCSDSSSVYTDCSDGCSSVGSGSSTGGGQPTYHVPVDYDADKFAAHLDKMQLYEKTASTQPLLKDQIATYLERQPDGPLGSQVRVLVYSGHNGRESTRLTVAPKVTYPWGNLHRLLQKVPPRVVVVVVFACCHAAEPLEEFIQNSTVPEIIALAACDKDEISKADNFKGDRFLDALLELLQHGGPQGCFEDWEPFVKAVVKNMTNFGTRNQHPVAYIRTNQTPSEILGALANPPVASGRGRTSAAVQS